MLSRGKMAFRLSPALKGEKGWLRPCIKAKNLCAFQMNIKGDCIFQAKVVLDCFENNVMKQICQTASPSLLYGSPIQFSFLHPLQDKKIKKITRFTN